MTRQNQSISWPYSIDDAIYAESLGSRPSGGDFAVGGHGSNFMEYQPHEPANEGSHLLGFKAGRTSEFYGRSGKQFSQRNSPRLSLMSLATGLSLPQYLAPAFHQGKASKQSPDQRQRGSAAAKASH
jgi:hypothetical protein